MELSSTSSSVWPGYVAAVSSLVLSLLLLAGVLVVSIGNERAAPAKVKLAPYSIDVFGFL